MNKSDIIKMFCDPQTAEKLKKAYKKLAVKYHPDLGGDGEIMKLINAIYDELFERLKNIHKAADGKTYEKESSEAPETFRKIINALIVLSGIKVELCGCWIWITGETKQHAETLKSLNCRWSKNKKAWYYHSEPFSKKRKGTMSLAEIRNFYGSEVFKTSGYSEEKKTIKEAS